jgi:hypothetical protein
MEWNPEELGEIGTKPELPPIELEEFKGLCSKLFELRKEKEGIETLLTAKNTELEDLKEKLLAYFEQYQMDSFKIPGLGTVGTQTKFQVSIPKDPDQKTKFMAYMIQNFPDLLGVNHQTLNAFFNSQVEAGNTEVPGLDTPKARRVITMRKG